MFCTFLIGDDFQLLQQNFMDKYCMQFDFEEENKLIYTDIHREYVSIFFLHMNDESSWAEYVTSSELFDSWR